MNIKRRASPEIISATVVTTTANLDALTAGDLDVYLYWAGL